MGFKDLFIQGDNNQEEDKKPYNKPHVNIGTVIPKEMPTVFMLLAILLSTALNKLTEQL